MIISFSTRLRMPHTKMKHLFQRYYEKTATAAETEELMQWMADPANEAELLRLMREGWDGLKPGEKVIASLKSEAILNHILPAPVRQLPPVSRFRLWTRVAAAAAIILLLSAGAYLLVNRPPAKAIAAKPAPVKNDVMPGGNKAVLTLANGKTIVLDSAGKGLLAQQGGTVVNKLQDGELVYDASAQSNSALGLNTVSTPRGGQYQVVLPDGSRVWLNAASSLRFPTAFSGRERNVELTGEAYFEIEKNREKPFHVLVNGMQVAVLGTHFNVMAYEDEAVVKTSLLEGRVKVSQGSNEVLLMPAQQASLDRERRQLVMDKNADVDKAVAWKNGLFDFENDDIRTIMRQLSRWYDVKIVFSGPVTEHYYTGEIRQKVPISQVLHMLELIGGVSFVIEGKTITVETR